MLCGEPDSGGGATQALEEEDGGDAAPEMTMLCEADSDEEEGLFGLREVGDISGEEAAAAFSSDEEEEEEGERAKEVGGCPHVGCHRRPLPRAHLCVGLIGRLSGICQDHD